MPRRAAVKGKDSVHSRTVLNTYTEPVRAAGVTVTEALTLTQARREPQRGTENHYRGALSQPHSVCAEIETPKGRKRGERGVPSPSD